MNVKELIKLLQGCEPEQQVRISMATSEEHFRIFGEVCEINEVNPSLKEITLICDGEGNYPFTVNYSKKYEIIGEIVCLRSDGNEEKCMCCNGKRHCYSKFLKLSYKSKFPSEFPKDLNNWIESIIDFESHEGQKIEITAEVTND